MTKVTLDMNTFKALASDTRLDILRTLDGKNMSLNEISRITRLNKATLHEHLEKLHEAGLVKRKEREGHKWVYYKLTWKGEGLLHPENTKIVVMFSVTFISLLLAVMLLVNFAQPVIQGEAITHGDTTDIYEAVDNGIPLLSKSVSYNYLGSINAINLTVGNVTPEIQARSEGGLKNSLGLYYTNNDIAWVTPDNVPLSYSQNIVDSVYYPQFAKGSNESNTTANKTLADGLVGSGDGYLGYTTAIPEMLAVAQDPTYLYYAIICLSFFGILFTLSTWKLIKNKKPIL